MLKFAIKAGIAGGTIYYTVSKGVWTSDIDRVENLYNDIQTKSSPYVSEIRNQIPYEVPRIVMPNFKALWNQGIKGTFRFIINIPDTTVSFVKTNLPIK